MSGVGVWNVTQRILVRSITLFQLSYTNFLIPYSIKLSGGVSVSKYTTETQYDYAARLNLQMQSYRLHLQV